MTRAIRCALVEDHKDTALSLIARLEDAGAQVQASATLCDFIGEDQLAEEPDVGIIDAGLSDSCRLTTLMSVRKRWPAVPLILYTALTDQLVLLFALRAGARAMITKDEGSIELGKVIDAVTGPDSVYLTSEQASWLAALPDVRGERQVAVSMFGVFGSVPQAAAELGWPEFVIRRHLRAAIDVPNVPPMTQRNVDLLVTALSPVNRAALALGISSSRLKTARSELLAAMRQLGANDQEGLLDLGSSTSLADVAMRVHAACPYHSRQARASGPLSKSRNC